MEDSFDEIAAGYKQELKKGVPAVYHSLVTGSTLAHRTGRLCDPQLGFQSLTLHNDK